MLFSLIADLSANGMNMPMPMGVPPSSAIHGHPLSYPRNQNNCGPAIKGPGSKYAEQDNLPRTGPNQTIDLHVTFNTDATGSLITRMCYRVGSKISPTLHFNVGDTVTIRVFNDLPSPDTVPAYEPVANRDPVTGRVYVRHFSATSSFPDETNIHEI